MTARKPEHLKRKAGRPAGAKNKTTIERERTIQLARERLAALDAARADAASQEMVRTQTAGVKLAKDVLEEFMRLFASMAARHQPLPPGMAIPPGREPDDAKFEKYAGMAVEAASRLAPFQSPRFSAVMVGATTINKVEVTGGMPDDFAAPAGIPAQALPAGTIVEAEEDYISPAAA